MSGKVSREEFKLKLNRMITELRSAIVSGTIDIGEYLPSELILADQYGLSKNSVRKGLEVLVAEGLIVKKSRIGNMVASNQSFDQIILRVGYYPSMLKDAHFQELIKRFEELHPNIKVQTISLPYNQYHQTVRDFFENDLLDVVTINHWDYGDFSTLPESAFEPMEKDVNLYTFLQTPFQSRDGKGMFVKPLIFSPVVLCYNKDHFDQRGIAYPDSGWNWDEALDAASKLLAVDSEVRSCGLYFHPLSINRWPIFLMQNKVEFSYNSSGRVDFPITNLINSVNFIKRMFEEQGILQTFLSDSDRDAEKLFIEQKASMIVTSYFSLNEMKDHDIDYDIAPIPYMEEAKTLLLIIGLAINRHSMKKEAAKIFVDFATGKEAQKMIQKETLSIPAFKKVAEEQGTELGSKPSRYHLFREIIPTFKLYSHLGLSPKDLGELRNELRIYLSDLMDDRIFLQRINAKLSHMKADLNG